MRDQNVRVWIVTGHQKANGCMNNGTNQKHKKREDVFEYNWLFVDKVGEEKRH